MHQKEQFSDGDQIMWLVDCHPQTELINNNDTVKQK